MLLESLSRFHYITYSHIFDINVNWLNIIYGSIICRNLWNIIIYLWQVIPFSHSQKLLATRLPKLLSQWYWYINDIWWWYLGKNCLNSIYSLQHSTTSSQDNLKSWNEMYSARRQHMVCENIFSSWFFLSRMIESFNG